MTPIRSILIFEDDDDARQLLLRRLRSLALCEGTRYWDTGLVDDAINYIAFGPEIAMLDMYAPQLTDHRHVRVALTRRSPATRCLVMTDTAQGNPWLVAETELAGINFIEKQRLLLGPLADLESILQIVQHGGQIPWSAPIRHAMATIIDQYAKARHRSKPLDSDVLLGVAPRFSVRAKDFIRILQQDPEDHLTYLDYAAQMGLASEQSVRDYPGRIAKTILQELDWLEGGVLAPEAAHELTERGLLKAGDALPQFSRSLVRALLHMIQFSL